MGVFNNSLILSGMLKCLEHHGLGVYTHAEVPAGDGGISLGQAVIAGSPAFVDSSIMRAGICYDPYDSDLGSSPTTAGTSPGTTVSRGSRYDQPRMEQCKWL